MASIVYLGLGSNVGDREENILCAIEELNSIGVETEKLSTIIETTPVGGPVQDKFLNAVLKAKTEILPMVLLKHTQFIERKLKRVKTVVNGPRIIDIDILLYLCSSKNSGGHDNLRINTSELTIPHPRMLCRDFVMRPLKEIEPTLNLKDFMHANNQEL